MNSPGTLPGQFSIGTLFDGRQAGDWQVLATDRAKSPPHVLAQFMAKGAEHAYKDDADQGESSPLISISKCRSCRSRDRQTWEAA